MAYSLLKIGIFGNFEEEMQEIGRICRICSENMNWGYIVSLGHIPIFLSVHTKTFSPNALAAY